MVEGIVEHFNEPALEDERPARTREREEINAGDRSRRDDDLSGLQMPPEIDQSHAPEKTEPDDDGDWQAQPEVLDPHPQRGSPELYHGAGRTFTVRVPVRTGTPGRLRIEQSPLAACHALPCAGRVAGLHFALVFSTARPLD